jgi:hypothetical protein
MERSRKHFKDTMKHKFSTQRILSASCDSQRTIATQPEAETRLLEQKFREKESILLSTVSWFWGKLKPTQICYLMQFSTDGTFLVTGFRETQGDIHNPNYSIAVKLQRKVYIFKVQHQNGELSLDFSNPQLPKALTLFALVSKIVQASKIYGSVGEISSDRGTILVSLIYPVLRISSLKAHCRRVIRLKYENNNTEDLPIPKALKTYLRAI